VRSVTGAQGRTPLGRGPIVAHGAQVLVKGSPHPSASGRERGVSHALEPSTRTDARGVVQRSATNCPSHYNPIFTRAPASRSAPMISRRFSRWRSSARRSPPSPGSTSQERSSTCCGCGAPRRLSAAQRLERALGRRRRIYYKDESVSPAGSHKPNTAVPQAFYNKQAGITRLATETGAGLVGKRSCVRLRIVRARVQGVHGACLVQPKAVPRRHDGGLGRIGRALPRR